MNNTEKTSDKKSLYIRIAVSAAVLLAAVIGCVLILKHDYEPLRTKYSGTYLCERHNTFHTENGEKDVYVDTYVLEYNRDGSYTHSLADSSSGGYYEFTEDGKWISYREGKLSKTYDVAVSGSDMLIYATTSIDLTVPEIVKYLGYQTAQQYVDTCFEDERVKKALLENDSSLLSGTDLAENTVEDVKLKISGVTRTDTLTFLTKETGLTYEEAMAIAKEKIK